MTKTHLILIAVSNLFVLLWQSYTYGQHCGRDAIYGALIDAGQPKQLDEIESVIGLSDSVSCKDVVEAIQAFGMQCSAYQLRVSDLPLFRRHMAIRSKVGVVLYVKNEDFPDGHFGSVMEITPDNTAKIRSPLKSNRFQTVPILDSENSILLLVGSEVSDTEVSQFETLLFWIGTPWPSIIAIAFLATVFRPTVSLPPIRLRQVFAGSLIFVLSIGLFWAIAGSSNSSVNSISVQNGDFDFGSAPLGHTVEQKIYLTNNTDAPITCHARASCSCIKVSAESLVLPPMQPVSVVISYDVMKIGHQEYDVSFLNGSEQIARTTLRGAGIYSPRIEPYFWYVGDVPMDRPWSKTIELNLEGVLKEYVPKEVTLNGALSAKLISKLVSDKENIKMLLTYNGNGQNAGFATSDVTITCSHDQESVRFICRLMINYKPSVEIVPTAVYMEPNKDKLVGDCTIISNFGDIQSITASAGSIDFTRTELSEREVHFILTSEDKKLDIPCVFRVEVDSREFSAECKLIGSRK
ncbi:hypothetical protein VN12_08505 [Pirellula sp. SH-Sr6A]|uniref:DUF1573 domain-containing protein n=1 Tax=Pirellula sp. SH-Sr6A TaxID=1632865 RepID=UPI00078E92EE|nr:DUF1573 domain-containing protein [Pirellula sp. SH-Sr6A]AMV32150.1 hypothetical protein VN12_08505 [Pirellula sp. SH-Sr6A]